MKVQLIDSEFFRIKIRKDRIRTNLQRKFWKSKLLIEVGEKGLKWFDYVKRVDRTMIPRRALKLNFRGKRPMG
jgi:hypothetical protein